MTPSYRIKSLQQTAEHWKQRALAAEAKLGESGMRAFIDAVEGMAVSVDVSTCDADAGHRYFGTVTEVSELDTAKNGYILLVQDAEPNFTPPAPAAPHHYACLTDNPRGPDYWTQCHKDYPGATAFYAAPQPGFEVELVATLTLKDSQHEWDRICYVPDGEHDLYILKEIEK